MSYICYTYFEKKNRDVQCKIYRYSVKRVNKKGYVALLLR